MLHKVQRIVPLKRTVGECCLENKYLERVSQETQIHCVEKMHRFSVKPGDPFSGVTFKL